MSVVVQHEQNMFRAKITTFQYAPVPVVTNPVLTYLAFASVRVFATFVPLIIAIFCFDSIDSTLEAFLRLWFGFIRLDCSSYHRASETTHATLAIVMFIV